MPNYCRNTTTKKYSIPSLTTEQLTNNPTLLQVQVVARHGARAPYYRVFCWDKVASPVDAIWNCGASAIISQDIGNSELTSLARGYGRLYKKAYNIGHNILTGTCSVGGLLPLGRKQHNENGRLLRDAYIGNGSLKLFRDGNLSNVSPTDIFLRSDDEERTLGSGQSLVDGMFLPFEDINSGFMSMLTWNTIDLSQDYINTNEKICPILSFITDQSHAGSNYLKYVNLDSSRILEQKLNKVFGKFDWGTLLECLMIARCNGIDLPVGMTEELFDESIEHVERREYLHLTYKDSWYAKTNMAPLMSEILGHMRSALEISSYPKFVVTMGHDSTLMPLLAAMLGESWDGKWAPYASMVVFELYKMGENSKYSSGKAVRLIYDGQVLTIPGCSDLCDYEQFLNTMQFGLNPRQCAIPNQDTKLYSHITSSTTCFMYLSILVTFLIVARKMIKKNITSEMRYLLS